MAHAAIRLSDLKALNPTEKTDVLNRLTAEAAARPNGQASGAYTRVRAFEDRYEISSEQLLTGLKDGSVRETAEINEWLFCLRLLEIGR